MRSALGCLVLPGSVQGFPCVPRGREVQSSPIIAIDLLTQEVTKELEQSVCVNFSEQIYLLSFSALSYFLSYWKVSLAGMFQA